MSISFKLQPVFIEVYGIHEKRPTICIMYGAYFKLSCAFFKEYQTTRKKFHLFICTTFNLYKT